MLEASAAFLSSSSFLRSSSSARPRAAVLTAAMRYSAMLAPRMLAFTAAGRFFRQQVGAGWQRRPAEGEPLEIAAELFLSVTGGPMKGLDERLADPAVFLETGGIARHRQAQQTGRSRQGCGGSAHSG